MQKGSSAKRVKCKAWSLGCATRGRGRPPVLCCCCDVVESGHERQTRTEAGSSNVVLGTPVLHCCHMRPPPLQQRAGGRRRRGAAARSGCRRPPCWPAASLTWLPGPRRARAVAHRRHAWVLIWSFVRAGACRAGLQRAALDGGSNTSLWRGGKYDQARLLGCGSTLPMETAATGRGRRHACGRKQS